jgi:hypothetical protein
MKKKKRSDKHEMIITILVVALLLLAAMFVLDITGSLNGESGEALNIATSVCFLTGHVDGMAKIERNASGYKFNCSMENVTLRYDSIANSGYIEWPKG